MIPLEDSPLSCAETPQISFHHTPFYKQHLNRMVRLREIPRTATFAFSPGSALPLVVTGTRAGAVDADFSDETKLELWDLNLDDVGQGVELQPIASISTDSRYVYNKLDNTYIRSDSSVTGSMTLHGHLRMRIILEA